MPESSKKSSDNSRRNGFFIRQGRKRLLLERFRRDRKTAQEQPPAEKKSSSAVLKFAVWLAVLFCIVIMFADQLCHFAATAVGSRILGAEITMDELEISFIRGDIKIINLRIKNPDNSTNPLLMEISSVYVAVDPLTVFGKETVVKQLELRNISIYGEITGNGKFNLAETVSALRNNDKDEQEKRFSFKKIRLDNLYAKITDHRLENNINGTSLFLHNGEISTATGTAALNLLEITPPTGYQGKLLSVKRAFLHFTPDIFYSPEPIINELTADGVHAVAGFQGAQRSSIHEVLRNCNMLFFPEAAENDDGDGSVLKIDRFSGKDISFSFVDTKKENSIHGFGVKFDELSGSLQDGNIRFGGLQVTNPDGFNRNMLNIKSAAISFVPGTFGTEHPEISQITGSTIRATVGFREDNHSNLYAICRSLEKFFIPFSSSNDASSDTDVFPVIGDFKLTDVGLSVWDARSSDNISGLGITIQQLSGSGKNGKLELRHLRVTPPAGYHNEDMLTLQKLAVEFDPASLWKDVLIIENISADTLRAAAGLKAGDQSNIGEVINSVELLLSPLNSPIAGEPTARKSGFTALRLKNCDLRNFKFDLNDSRSKNNVHGLNVTFKQLTFSESSMTLHLHDLIVANPAAFTRKKMLTLANFSTVLAYEQDEYLMKRIEIDGLHCVAEFNKNDQCNIHLAADAVSLVFRVQPECRNEQLSREQKKYKTFVREYYKISNSSLTILEAEQGIPLSIQLSQEMKNESFESDDSTLLESLHQMAVYLENICAGKTKINILNIDRDKSKISNVLHIIINLITAPKK